MPSTHQKLLEPGSPIYDLYSGTSAKWKPKDLPEIFEKLRTAVKSIVPPTSDAYKFSHQPDLMFTRLGAQLNRWLVDPAVISSDSLSKYVYHPPVHPMRIEHRHPKSNFLCFEANRVGKFQLTPNKFVSKRPFSIFTQPKRFVQPIQRRITLKF